MSHTRQIPHLAYVPKRGIATAADKIGRMVGRMPQRQFMSLMLRKMGVEDKLKEPKKKTPPVMAFVNHGRWVANCECGGCEVVDRKDPVFMCFSCANFGAGEGELRPVIFPDDAGRIEAALKIRDKQNRNCNLGQAASSLEVENVEHGLVSGPIPVETLPEELEP